MYTCEANHLYVHLYSKKWSFALMFNVQVFLLSVMITWYLMFVFPFAYDSNILSKCTELLFSFTRKDTIMLMPKVETLGEKQLSTYSKYSYKLYSLT